MIVTVGLNEMLQPTGGGDATRSGGYVNSWRVPRLVNSASDTTTEPPRAAKRQLRGTTSNSEPAIKQERLDPGYDRAMAQPSGTVLGSIMPMTNASVPRQVTVFSRPTAQPPSVMSHRPVQIWPQPQRAGNAIRQNKILNVVNENHRNNIGGPVVLLRPGVALPFLPRDLMRIPNAFGMSTPVLTPTLTPNISSFGNINGHNNRTSNQRVVLLPRSTVDVPHQSSFPTFLPSRPTSVPNVCISRHGPISVSAPANSTTPLIVFVSRPSTMTGARIVCTGNSLTSTITTSSVSHTITRACLSAPQANNSDPLAQLKAIIGKRVLEKYVGLHIPPPELHMPVHYKHICQSCGDEFVTESGLESHLSRRSMLISFSCTSCILPSLQQVFYNPCSFEKFYRTHCFQVGGHTTSDSIVVSALDLDTTEYQSRADSLYQQTDNKVSQSSVHTSTAQCATTNADSNSNLQSSIVAVKETHVDLEVEPDKQENPQILENYAKDSGTIVIRKTNNVVKLASAAKRGLPKSKLADDASLLGRVEDFSNALCHNRTKCQECFLDCKTRQELSAHFSVSSEREMLRCTSCELRLPTACSFSAHVRMHKNLSPFVCPQCGIVFDEAESVEVFNAHVERYCFHLMQTSSGPSASKCPRCKFTETDESKMVHHFIDVHAAVYYKCRSCPKAFVNDSAAQRHSENTGHDAQMDTVRKCASCDVVFKDSAANEMESHAIDHFAPLVQCPVCPVTAGRSSVIEHLHSCHPDVILPTTTCEVCGQPHANQKDLFSHVSTKHIDYYESVMKCLSPAVEKPTFNTECASQPQSEPNSNVSIVSSEETTSVSLSEVPTRAISTPFSSVSTVSISEPATISKSDIQSSTPTTEQFHCSRCQMNFSSEDMYKRHKAKHRFLKAKKARKKQAATKPYDDPLQQVRLLLFIVTYVM